MNQGTIKRDHPKKDACKQFILEAIHRGEFPAHKHLPSIRQLTQDLPWSQRVITTVLKELVAEHCLEQKAGACFYISPQYLLKEKHQQSPPSQQLEPSHPKPTVSNTLRVFITDRYPSMLEYWKNLELKFRDQFPSIDLQIRYGIDLEIGTLVRQNTVDLVYGSQRSLHAAGPQTWHHIDWEAFDLPKEDIIQSIVDFVDRDVPYIGVPFSAAVKLLFLNRTQLHSHGIQLDGPLSLDTLGQNIVQVYQRADHSVKNVMDRVHVFFMLAGALKRMGPHMDFERDITAHWLQIFQGVGEQVFQPRPSRMENLKRSASDLSSHFNQGRSPLFISSSFQRIPLKELKPNFEVDIIPCPTAEHGVVDGGLGSFALSKNSLAINEAIEFIRYCLNTENQIAYSQLGGNLPIRKSALDPKDEPFLEKADFFQWPPSPQAQKLEDDIDYCAKAYWAGRLSLKDTIKRLEILFDLLDSDFPNIS